MFTSQLVMDVLDELEEKSATHSTHDASEVVILTDFARKHGASKASRIWTDLHKDSARGTTTCVIDEGFAFIDFYRLIIRNKKKDVFLFEVLTILMQIGPNQSQNDNI